MAYKSVNPNEGGRGIAYKAIKASEGGSGVAYASVSLIEGAEERPKHRSVSMKES